MQYVCSHNFFVYIHNSIASDENSKDDISYIPIAGGVGGTVLLMILCGVILFVRSYCKRIAYRTGNTENVSLSQLRNTRTSAPNPIYASAADLDVDYVDNGKWLSISNITPILSQCTNRRSSEL